MKPRLSRIRRSAIFLALALLLALPATPASARDSATPAHSPVAAGQPQSPERMTFKIGLSPGEVPGGGDAEASGRAWMILLPEAESVCYLIKWKQLEGVVTAAHIHAAAKGLTGPHHIDLFNDLSLSDTKDRTSSCVKVQHGGHGGHLSAQDKIWAVIAAPENYYLNVHSSAFPAGAIRGQLG